MKHIVTLAAPANLKVAGAFTGVDWKFTKVTYDEVTKEELSRVAQPQQFHHLVGDKYDHVAAGAIYAAQWDGVSEKLNVLVGSPSLLTHKFLGWPDA